MLRVVASVTVFCLLVVVPPQPLFADASEALIERVCSLTQPRGKLAKLSKTLGKQPDEQRDLGFGGSWARFQFTREHLLLHVDAVTHRDWLAGVQVTVRRVPPALGQRLRDAWGKPLRVDERGMVFRAEKSDEMERLRRATWKGLGNSPSGRIGGLHDGAVKTLMDPMAALTFGTACYEDGSAPAGRDLVRKLWLGGERDNLEKILVCPNPEGRVYAAEALLRLDLERDRLGKVDRPTIARVLALAVPIRSCRGCLVEDRLASVLAGEPVVRAGVLCRVLDQSTFRDRAFTERRIFVYRDGLRMVERLTPPATHAPPSALMIDRALLPEDLLRPLAKAVAARTGLETRDGLPTFVIAPEQRDKAPSAVRDLLDSLPLLPK